MISDDLDAAVLREQLTEVAGGTGTEARRARYRLRRLANADSSTCPSGHLYATENTVINASGRRVCLTCKAARAVRADR